MFVKPAPFIDGEGIERGPMRVHDPDAKDILPEDGRDVPDTEYWARRLRDGDVIALED